MVAWKHFEFIFVPTFEHRCILKRKFAIQFSLEIQRSLSIERFTEIANVIVLKEHSTSPLPHLMAGICP